MKRFLLITSVLSLMAVTACKKDKHKASDPATPATPSVPSGYSGIFTVASFTNVLGGSTYVSSGLYAYFSSKPVTFSDTLSAVQVDSVSIDGNDLSYISSLKQYYLSGTVPLSSQVWRVKGANGIPDLTGSSSAISMPVSQALSNLPNQLSKSAGFTLSIDCANTTSGSFLLIAPGTSGSGTFAFALKGGSNTINVPASQLATLNTGSNAMLLINLVNEAPLIVSGKRFNFTKQAQVLVQNFTINP